MTSISNAICPAKILYIFFLSRQLLLIFFLLFDLNNMFPVYIIHGIMKGHYCLPNPKIVWHFFKLFFLSCTEVVTRWRRRTVQHSFGLVRPKKKKGKRNESVFQLLSKGVVGQE